MSIRGTGGMKSITLATCDDFVLNNDAARLNCMVAYATV